MKYLMIIAAALTITHNANAAVPPGQQVLFSVNQLEADAREYARMFEDDQDCAVQISKFSDGIRISLENRGEGLVQLDVKYNNAVAFTRHSEFDSSFVKEYEVPGQGILTAISADDAYFELTLEANGKKISCKQDF